MSAEWANEVGAKTQQRGRLDDLVGFELIRANLKGTAPLLIAAMVAATVSVFFELVPISLVHWMASATIDGTAMVEFFL